MLCHELKIRILRFEWKITFPPAAEQASKRRCARYNLGCRAAARLLKWFGSLILVSKQFRFDKNTPPKLSKELYRLGYEIYLLREKSHHSMNCSRYLNIQLRADSGIQIKFRLYSVLRQVQNSKLSYRRLKIIVFQWKLSYAFLVHWYHVPLTKLKTHIT